MKKYLKLKLSVETCKEFFFDVCNNNFELEWKKINTPNESLEDVLKNQ